MVLNAEPNWINLHHTYLADLSSNNKYYMPYHTNHKNILIKKYQIAESLGIHPRTFSNKLGGTIRFSAEEAIQIQEQWFSDMTINELFKKEA